MGVPLEFSVTLGEHEGRPGQSCIWEARNVCTQVAQGILTVHVKNGYVGPGLTGGHKMDKFIQ